MLKTTQKFDISEFDIITSKLMRAQHTALQILSVLTENYQDTLEKYNLHRNNIVNGILKKKDEYDNKYVDEFTYQLNVSDLCSTLTTIPIPKNLNKISRRIKCECIPCKDVERTQYCDNFGSN